MTATGMNWFLKKDVNEKYAYLDGAIPSHQVDFLVNSVPSLGLASGGIEKDAQSGEVLESLRKSNIHFLPMTSMFDEVYRHTAGALAFLNEKVFQFDLTHMEQLQFTEYKGEEHGHYGCHVDHSYDSVPAVYRKLSFSLLLTDPATYEGGNLLLYPWNMTPIVAPLKKGTMVAFPSNILHEVVPLTKGTRHSLVGWAHGPRFK